MLEEVRSQGGGIIAVTSEPQSLADEAQRDWGLSFPCIGDPHHEIRTACQERGWLDIFFNPDTEMMGRSWSNHPNGYYQPGVVAVTREGRVLYRWRSVPNRKNMGGAGARPEASYTWEQIQSGLQAEGDAELDTHPKMDNRNAPWPVFMLLLLAHGWFLRAKTFPLAREGDKASAKITKMPLRIAGFFLLLVALAITMPIEVFALILALWIAKVAPSLMVIHRRFQNEPNPY